MTDNEMRIAIAEACGVKPTVTGWCAKHPDQNAICFSADTAREVNDWLPSLPSSSPFKTYVVRERTRLPDYPRDLNACHEMENRLTLEQRNIYCGMLPGFIPWTKLHTIAAHRAEAISDWTKSIDICPDCAKIYQKRAFAYYKKEDYDKAWDDVHKVEELGFKVEEKFLQDLRKYSEREK